MRITFLTIKNFKGIDEHGVRIEFAPITLLFGPNNAGKSTVMQALYLAREAFCQTEPDLEYTEPSGKGLDLGSFKDYVHKHDLSRTVSIGLELQTDGLPLLDDSLELQQWGGWEEIEPLLEMVESVYVEVGIRWNAGLAKAELVHCAIFINGTHLTTIELDSRTLTAYFRHLNTAPFLPKESIEILTGNALESIWERIDSHPDDYGNDFLDYREKVFDHIHPLLQPFTDLDKVVQDIATIDLPVEERKPPIMFPLGHTPILDWDSSFIPLEYESIQPDHDPQAVSVEFSMNCLTLLSNLLIGPCRLVKKFLNSLLYVGPLRAIPDRGEHRPQKPSFHRWADGIAAWDMLATVSDNELKRFNRYLHIDQSEERGQDGDEKSTTGSLDIGYTVKRERILTLAENAPLADALRKTLLDDFDEDALPYLREFLAQTPETRIRLQNINSSVAVEPHDMGVGISQVLPIVAAATFAPFNAFVMVEQPALHIHPKIQVALGDIFIQAALADEDAPMFLLETHSEHLLLRLLRRIRQTAEGSVSHGLEFTPANLAVNWIGNEEGRTTVLRIEVTDDGTFNTLWPEGFFEERGVELFE